MVRVHAAYLFTHNSNEKRSIHAREEIFPANLRENEMQTALSMVLDRLIEPISKDFNYYPHTHVLHMHV